MKWLPWIALIVGGLALLFREEAQGLVGLDEMQFAQLLIAITLIAFIGTSVLAGYRGRVAMLARNIGVVALMGVCAAAGYTYKSEMAELALRITSEFLPPGEAQHVLGRGGWRHHRLVQRLAREPVPDAPEPGPIGAEDDGDGRRRRELQVGPPRQALGEAGGRDEGDQEHPQACVHVPSLSFRTGQSHRSTKERRHLGA